MHEISFIDWTATVISGTTVTGKVTVTEATVTEATVTLVTLVATVIPPIPALRPF